MKDIKTQAIRAIGRAFSAEGPKLNDIKSSNVKDDIIKQIQKSGYEP